MQSEEDRPTGGPLCILEAALIGLSLLEAYVCHRAAQELSETPKAGCFVCRSCVAIALLRTALGQPLLQRR